MKGYYIDNALNRRLGRVGMLYGTRVQTQYGGKGPHDQIPVPEFDLDDFIDEHLDEIIEQISPIALEHLTIIRANWRTYLRDLLEEFELSTDMINNGNLSSILYETGLGTNIDDLINEVFIGILYADDGPSVKALIMDNIDESFDPSQLTVVDLSNIALHAMGTNAYSGNNLGMAISGSGSG